MLCIAWLYVRSYTMLQCQREKHFIMQDDTEKLLALFEAYFERNKSDQAQTVADIFKQFLVGSTAGEKFDSFIHTIGDVLCGQEME